MRTLALLACLLPLPLLAGPPPTEKRPVPETFHGTTLTDDYRWLEGDAGKPTDAVRAWTAKQNAYTRSVLDALPGRKALEQRLASLMRLDSIDAPQMAGSRYFYRARRGDQNQSVLYVRDRHDGPERALIDPNTLDARGLVSLDWIHPGPKGERLAFGISHAGSEASTLHVLDVATGRWLADELPGKTYLTRWMPDGRSFFYSTLADPDDAYSRRIRHHVLGRHRRHDRTLVRQKGTRWGPFANISHDGRWMVLGRHTSTRSNDLWVVDLDRWFRTREFVQTPILVGADARARGRFLGDTFLMQTTLDAPNGRVIAVDLHDPRRERWKDLVPERPDHNLRGVEVARGVLILNYLHKARSLLLRARLDGTILGPLELPGANGTAHLRAHPDRTEAFLTYSSFHQPPTIYRVDVATGERTLWAKPEVPFDPSTIDVQQVTYDSKDGTKITMFLVHKKGLKRDGNNPTLLYGYGGFNISLTPRFSATLLPWLEAGGVYAVPNLRGGGEYGDAWHRAGTLERKQNVFDDFIAAAEWLVASKITRRERLAISGGSNGGLLTGAVLVQRPDLCQAAISRVPLLDMLRYQRFLMARFWVPEYGTAEDPKQFAFLRKYSPYQNIKPETRYPAVLLTAGENDARVHPCHARKMAAALQAATTSDPKTRPVLLWVEMDGGHGRGMPLKLRIRALADRRMFLRWQLGMK